MSSPVSTSPLLDGSEFSTELLKLTPLERWDDLKKSSRRMEGLVYNKLTDFSKAIQQVNTHHREEDEKKTFALEKEIKELLTKLERMHDEMEQLLSSSSESAQLNTDNNSYTLQRYRTILSDYSQEFKKNLDQFNAYKTRAQLMTQGNGTNLLAQEKNSLAVNKGKTELLLREKNSLQQSLKMTDDVISQAQYARNSLLNQGRVLLGVGGKLGSLGTKFPMVNRLLGKITSYKNRDMIVLAIVIASCMFFTVIYIANKGS